MEPGLVIFFVLWLIGMITSMVIILTIIHRNGHDITLGDILSSFIAGIVLSWFLIIITLGEVIVDSNILNKPIIKGLNNENRKIQEKAGIRKGV